MRWLAIAATLTGVIMFFSSQVARADAPEIGQPAPNFKLPDQNGKIHTLDNFRGK